MICNEARFRFQRHLCWHLRPENSERVGPSAKKMRQDLGVGTSLKVKVGRVGKQSVISRNFGFRLSDEQLQAAADILKMHDGNIRSTKE